MSDENTKMNPEVKAKWLERLRSGTIPQIAGRLGNTEGGRCCLGVLCDIAVEEGVIPEAVLDPVSGYYRYGNPNGLPLGVFDTNGTSTATLPVGVQTWAGVRGKELELPVPVNFNPERNPAKVITLLNDAAGYTFPQIADVIEEQL